MVSIEIVVARYAEKLDWAFYPLFAQLQDAHRQLSNRALTKSSYGVTKDSEVASKMNHTEGIQQKDTENSSLKDKETTISLQWTIYNKGSPISEKLPQNCRVIDLDNVGRESHTYLYHIVNNFDHLADVTIFLPGSCMDATKRSKTENLIAKVLETFSTVLIGQSYGNVCKELFSFRMSDWHGSNIRNQEHLKTSSCKFAAIRPLGKWYRHYFNNLNTTLVCWQSIFAISKDHIQNRSIDSYNRLLLSVSHHSNPEEGHYMERSWEAVFSPIPKQCLYATNSKRKNTVTRIQPSSGQGSFTDILKNFQTTGNSSSRISSTAPISDMESIRNDELQSTEQNHEPARKKVRTQELTTDDDNVSSHVDR